MLGHPHSELEEKVKELIRQSLQKRIAGLDQIDPGLDNDKLIGYWLTDVMAIGFYWPNLERAASEIFSKKKPLAGNLMPDVLLKDSLNRAYFALAEFSDEMLAFRQYVELKGKEAETVVLAVVEKKLANVCRGDLKLAQSLAMRYTKRHYVTEVL